MLAYNRVMILYRKQKMYKKELSAIKKAINAYEKDILKDQQAWKKINGHTAELSQNLARALGLMDDKGLPMISIIGDVPLTHITSYARLLNLTETQAWESALAPKVESVIDEDE